jgi:hypothetical protein
MASPPDKHSPRMTPILTPEPEITLEEWIEATQSCCGIDHDETPQHPVLPVSPLTGTGVEVDRQEFRNDDAP